MNSQNMPAEVVLRLRPEVSSAARGRAGSGSAVSAAEAIAATVQRFGGALVPQHPDPADPDLGGYFRVELPPSSDGEALARELHGLGGVEAAYVKPLPAMP